MRTFNNLKIGTKINLLVMSILIVFSVVLGFVVQNLVVTGVKESAIEKARSDLNLGFRALEERYPGDWEIRNNQLYKGNVLVNENIEMVDYIADMTGGSVTIFQGDTRITTNVVVDGNRAVGTQASDMISQTVLQEGKTFFGEADVAGTLNQTAYQPIHNPNGEAIGMWFVGVSEQFIDDTVGTIFNGLLVVLVIGIGIASTVVFLFAHQMKKRLNLLGDALEKAGQGDFTTHVSDQSKDEIGQLTNSYNLMKNNLNTLIKHVVETSEQVAASSEELTAGAEETSRATDQISESIQAIASGSENQVNTTMQANQSSVTISDSMQAIKSSVKTVTHSSTSAKEKSETGINVIQQAISQMNLIEDKTEDIATIVQELGTKSSEIGNIITIITTVAEQTNLLALNAAIEAARAGAHGKGFAVVADEVRKLAEQSSGSASQIRNLIQDIQQQIDKSVVSMDDTKEAVKEGITIVGSAGNEFEGISTSINDVTNQIEEVSNSVQQITDQMKTMVTFIDDASNTAEGSASYSQEVAAAAEEQNASMEEITAAATTLSEMAESLQEAVKKFKL
ncbi:methyl-accepting chemotaxis protein [Alkalihalophilus marmarensis]|uniref:Methyl-accepting chemotaxis protein n=1 Tax=Alkalihalophilus marmarensis DSM 21297 TaxID=1188261 RepID=U6SHW9_9BACI|nr:methyl-accepting chemotaxis protein [Alkalihalophilus marmarensis]ERN51173.1 hypothetical protein A33I_20820 [Alkalihalophilus marmarensis DSM 21297]